MIAVIANLLTVTARPESYVQAVALAIGGAVIWAQVDGTSAALAFLNRLLTVLMTDLLSGLTYRFETVGIVRGGLMTTDAS
jgi:hypothetical protein